MRSPITRSGCRCPDATSVVDSVAVSLRAYKDITITNSGLVQGDYAFLSLERYGETLNNSGTVRGIVDLALGDDRIGNTGAIEGEVRLGDAWRVKPTDDLIAALRGEFAGSSIEIVY